MWGLFRSSSQDGEHVHKSSSSKALQPDTKTVKTNLEKLRGYHELAKARLPHLFFVLGDLEASSWR